MGTEIPLVYPGLEANPRRYVVEEDCQIRRVSVDCIGDDQSSNSNQDEDQYIVPSEENLHGSASISTFTLRGKDVILTTSALVDAPHILSVALSWTSDPMESPQLIQLDLRKVIAAKLFNETTVKVQGFSEDTSSGVAIRLVLVDSRGTFLTVLCSERLARLTSTPARIISLSDYLATANAVEQVSNSTLQPNMVAFVTSSYVCIALAPFIVAVDVLQCRSTIWSETQCLDCMQSGLSKLFSKTSEVLMGKMDGSLVDMPPTAAMCLAVRPNSLLDPYFLFTVHSDASVRKWTIQPEASLSPSEVYKLEVGNVDLPNPSEWSDAANSVVVSSRLYGQVYALVLHIQTYRPYFSARQGQHSASDCHLRVLHGSQYNDAKATGLTLDVPAEADSLVNLSFVPGISRCTLGALYRTKAGMMDITYPPSFMSMLTTQPIVNDCHGSLDNAAREESSRVRALSPNIYNFDPNTSTSDDSTLGERMHDLDTKYMKHLFRPIYPRGTGTVLPPSRSCVRAALSKLVRGYNVRQPYPEDYSVEVETLRAMQDWKNKDSRKQGTRTPSKAPPSPEAFQDALSSPQLVYKSYVDCSDDDKDEMDFENTAQEEEEASIEDQIIKLQQHDARWKSLLLQILEEEESLRKPLNSSWIEAAQSLQVIVRAGITTVLMVPPHNVSSENQHGNEEWAVLDRAAMALLSVIEMDGSKSDTLHQMEHDICNLISSADLILTDSTTFQPLLQKFQVLAEWAWSGDGAVGIPDDDHQALEEVAESISIPELVKWVGSRPATAAVKLPGIELCNVHKMRRHIDGMNWGRLVIANCQLRHAACSLANRCAESTRRLRLARWLLLSDLVEGGHAATCAQRAYFQSVATLWTSAQHVAMPNATFHSARSKTVNLNDSSDAASPLGKRLSFGDDTHSLLHPSKPKMTTVLDVVMMATSQRLDSALVGSISPVEVTLLIGMAFIDSAFPADAPESFADRVKNELGALPAPRDVDVVTDYPRLAIRLLSPFVAFPFPEEKEYIVQRNETVAECLLIESHARSQQKSSEKSVELMRQRASGLLIVDKEEDEIDSESIELAIDALKSMRRTPAALMGENLEESLETLLQQIIYNDVTHISIGIRRLAKLESARNLFLPLLGGVPSEFDSTTREAIQKLARLLLLLSRLMHRVNVIARHTKSIPTQANQPDQGSLMLMTLLRNVIDMFETSIPEKMRNYMPEYINLWSNLFQHSVNARAWTQALEACTSNPDEGRRDGDFRQLVRDMVDSGALEYLVNKCQSVSTRSPEEAVDLYQVAKKVLTNMSLSGDEFYTLRATSPHPFQISDYLGALYALHVSQNEWRRASQAMDLRYIGALNALDSVKPAFQHSLGASVLRDTIIVEDMALASVGALNSLLLVDDAARRYFVSGESGLDVDHIDAGAIADATSKRTRLQSANQSRVSNPRLLSRIDRLMTPIEVEGRAIRSLSLRTLFMDKSIDPTIAKQSFLRDFDTANDDVQKLFELGYYFHGLLLSKTISSNYKSLTGSSGIEGQDIFINALRIMLEEHIVPLALGTSKQGFEGVTNTDCVPSRPSLQQIQNTLSCIDRDPVLSFSRAEHYKTLHSHPKDLVTKSAMLLLRKATCFHASSQNSVAANVAKALLETSLQANGFPMKCPLWLEELLKGKEDSGSTFASVGSADSTTFTGDPSALLSIYINHGLLQEGCDLVTAILSRDNTKSMQHATTLLPEKGGILTVPYTKIDLLWNLIDLATTTSRVSRDTGKHLLSARGKMESALEKHYELLKVSEIGQQSARALQRSKQ